MLEVKICSGTACFVMGGADLFKVEEMLSNDEKKKVKFVFVPCLGYCKDGKKKAPFVVINGELYEKVTADSLLKTIREKIGGL